MTDPLLDPLRAIVGAGGLLCGAELQSRPAGYMRPDTIQARLLVRPKDTAQVAAVLKLCHGAGRPVVTHGGLTGLVHGADTTPGDLVLSLERMNRIEEIDPLERIAVVQAGVPLQALQESAASHNLLFPLDLGARGSATLGGNASTNAGGNRVIRFGMMRDMVLGLEVVLADGTVLSSMNRMIKNNAGYDLKHLFIGAEGTLGVITRLVLRLRERPLSQDVAFVAVDNFANVVALLKHMDRALGGGLSAFEVMWHEFYELVTTAPAKSTAPLPYGHAHYVLIESSGANAEQDRLRFSSALEAAHTAGLIADAVLAQSERERAAIWGMRDDVPQLRRYGTTFTFDVSLPISTMEGFVGAVRAALTARWPQHRCWVFGHLGDGNLHVVVYAADEAESARREAEGIVYGELARVGGSISAEHGIGLEKKPYLGLSRSAAEIALMRALKQTLDPKNLLNPGKIY